MSSLLSQDVFGEMCRRVPELAVDPDEWIRMMMRWHFSDDTGSQYWVQRRRSLGFDPIGDVRRVEDLLLFDLFDKEVLRRIDVVDLVPKAFDGKPRRIFETGGTSGPPCRVVDVTMGAYNVALYRVMLEVRGLAGGDILAMTPSGPHAYGTFVGRLADTWGGNVCYIDFDPRWIKELIREGRDADPYVDHLLRQTIELLHSQKPALLFTTSKLLIALVAALDRPLSSYGIKAICTGGTSCSSEEQRYLRENFLQEVQWIDTYGNTLMGHALQADPCPGDRRRAYYLPSPQAFIKIVDPENWRSERDLGVSGRVLLQTLHRDLFIPNLLERDVAKSVAPHPWFPFRGVANVGPYTNVNDERSRNVEGVY
jgi:phenylacetate-coenzyme A ligase PaaK-like adenylate-forming protein